MKKTHIAYYTGLGILCLALLSVAAGLGTPSTVFSTATGTEAQGVTNAKIAATVAAPINAIINVENFDNLAVQVRLQATDTATGNNTLVIQKSVDGSSWDTLNTTTLAASGTATNAAITNYNVALLGHPWVRFSTLTAGTATTLTNVTIKVYPKK